MAHTAWQSQRRREEAVRRGCQASLLAGAAGRLVAMSSLPSPPRRIAAQRQRLLNDETLAAPRLRRKERAWPWLTEVTAAGGSSTISSTFSRKRTLGLKGESRRCWGASLSTPFPMCLLQWTANDAATDMLCGVRVLYGSHPMFFLFSGLCFLHAHA